MSDQNSYEGKVCLGLTVSGNIVYHGGVGDFDREACWQEQKSDGHIVCVPKSREIAHLIIVAPFTPHTMERHSPRLGWLFHHSYPYSVNPLMGMPRDLSLRQF